MATTSTPLQALDGQGLTPKGTVHWNLISADAHPGGRRPRRGEPRRHGAVRRRHRAAHRPLAQRQVRRARAVERRATSTGARSTSRSAKRTSSSCKPTCASTSTALDELFVQDLYCGADPAHRLSVRYVTPNAWHASFVRNMFIRPEAAELDGFAPNFTVLHAPEFRATRRTPRHAHRHLHRAAPGAAHDPHRRHALRR